MRVLPLLLLFAALPVWAATLQERADAAFARVPVRADQETQYTQIVQDYYQRQSDIYKRSVRQSSSGQSSGEGSSRDLEKLLKSRNHKLSGDIVKKMGKVLDAKQMEEFRYAIELADRSFLESVASE